MPWRATFPLRDQTRFVRDHGEIVTVYQAVRCPCGSTPSAPANLACAACGGFGYWYPDAPTTARMVLSRVVQQEDLGEYGLTQLGDLIASQAPGSPPLAPWDLILTTWHDGLPWTGEVRTRQGLVANPTAYPVLSAVADSSSTLPAGSYLVGFTYTNAAGSTLLSPTQTVTITAGQGIQVGAVPLAAGATGTGIYLSTTVNGTTLALATTGTGAAVTLTALPTGGAPPTTNTAVNAVDLLTWRAATVAQVLQVDPTTGVVTPYTSPADYTVSGKALTWTAGGQAPAAGSLYSVRYTATYEWAVYAPGWVRVERGSNLGPRTVLRKRDLAAPNAPGPILPG